MGKLRWKTRIKKHKLKPKWIKIYLVMLEWIFSCFSVQSINLPNNNWKGRIYNILLKIPKNGNKKQSHPTPIANPHQHPPPQLPQHPKTPKTQLHKNKITPQPKTKRSTSISHPSISIHQSLTNFHDKIKTYIE